MTVPAVSPRYGKDDYQIHVNFLSVNLDLPPVLIYRRICASRQEEKPVPQASSFRLSESRADERTWQSYWIVMEPEPGFDPFEFELSWNGDITRRILFAALRRSVEAKLEPSEYRFPDNSFITEVSFTMHAHPEGEELLVVQPYSLKALHQSGFLVDFHFRLAKDVRFSRRIQQLSLSLDRNFKRNVDYCADRAAKIKRFVELRWPVFEALTLPGQDKSLAVSKDFARLPAERLRPKVYLFSGAKESRSQFTGLREHGPLQPLDGPPRLLFAFREQDRQAARHLALALRGMKQRGQYNFPGFKELFKTPLEIDANPIVLPGLSPASMEEAMQRASAARQTSPRLLPVLVLPNGDDNGYLAQKAYFSHAGAPARLRR